MLYATATSCDVNVETIAWNKSGSKKAYKVRTLLRIYLSKKVNLSWILPFLMIKKISWTLLADEKSSPNDGHFYRFLNKISNPAIAVIIFINPIFLTIVID